MILLRILDFFVLKRALQSFYSKSLLNLVLWVSMGPQRRKERGSENIENMSPQKYQQMSHICSKRRVPERDFFMVFRVPIPGWAPRRPQAGSKAQKHVKMEAWRWISGYFITMISYSLETLGRCFVYSMNNLLIILDVKFMVLFV